MRAAIYVYLGGEAPIDKQRAAAAEYCMAREYQANTMVHHPEDALILVRQGIVDVVVAAYAPSDEAHLADLVAAAGGKIEYARPSKLRMSLDVIRMIRRMADRGMTVAEISEISGETTGEIRTALYRRRPST